MTSAMVMDILDELIALPLVPVADWRAAGIPPAAVLDETVGAIRQTRAVARFGSV